MGDDLSCGTQRVLSGSPQPSNRWSIHLIRRHMIHNKFLLREGKGWLTSETNRYSEEYIFGREGTPVIINTNAQVMWLTKMS